MLFSTKYVGSCRLQRSPGEGHFLFFFKILFRQTKRPCQLTHLSFVCFIFPPHFPFSFYYFPWKQILGYLIAFWPFSQSFYDRKGGYINWSLPVTIVVALNELVWNLWPRERKTTFKRWRCQQKWLGFFQFLFGFQFPLNRLNSNASSTNISPTFWLFISLANKHPTISTAKAGKLNCPLSNLFPLEKTKKKNPSCCSAGCKFLWLHLNVCTR